MAEIPPFVQTTDRAFVRDTRNRALLNTDRAALERHRTARQRSGDTAKRIQSLESQVAELTALVHQLLSK
jgi:uncharacterized protein YceH (UPF0502 family)